MTPGQLRLYNDLRIEFISRCEHICYLLKDLRNYRFMSKFKLDLDNDEVDCWDEYDGLWHRFPVDFIYKPDDEIIQWKNEMLEKERKEKEENEKLEQEKERKEKYRKFLELKRVFEK